MSRASKLGISVCVLVVGAAGSVLMAGCGDSVTGIAPPITDPEYYPQIHDEAAWSSLGVVAYTDCGLVLREDGSTYYDHALAGIWLMHESSGPARLLVPGGRSPSWSSDGFELACLTSSGIVTVDMAGTVTSVLGLAGFHPDWKPDGSRIAWSIHSGQESGVWSAAVDGSDVTRHLRHASDPDWHPTEDLILCDAWVDEIHAIVTISRWSSVPEIVKLSDPAAHVFCGTAEYSLDGQYIVYERSDWSGPYTSEIWVMNSDGTSSAQLVDGRCSNPTWSPDGTKVAYSRSDPHSSAPADNVLWVVDVVTREQTQLTNVLTEESAARLTSVCSRRAWLSRCLQGGGRFASAAHPAPPHARG